MSPFFVMNFFQAIIKNRVGQVVTVGQPNVEFIIHVMNVKR